MNECAFEEYLFKERKKRWETKIEIEKIEQKVNYLLSSDNDACYGKYLNSQSSVLHFNVSNCEHGVKELSYLEEKLISSFNITALFLLKSQDMINQ